MSRSTTCAPEYAPALAISERAGSAWSGQRAAAAAPGRGERGAQQGAGEERRSEHRHARTRAPPAKSRRSGRIRLRADGARVVKLDVETRKPAAGAASQDRAGPRRGRLHRRRLRDRRAARSGPAVGQPHDQRLRRLRRDERGGARGRADRQRRHAGADDAGRQRPGRRPAVPRHRPRDAAAPELPRVRGQGPQAAVPPSGVAAQLARPRRSSAPSTSAIALAEALPSGLYRAPGSRPTCARCSARRAAPTTSGELAAELYLAATDLDTCERLVLGAEGWDDVPISSAVRASTALPMVYERRPGQGPRAGRRRHRLDHEPRHRGRGGREVHRRRQPAGALRERLHEGDPDAVRHAGARRVSDMGFPKIGYQTFKLLAYQRLHEMAASGRSATRASTSS